MLCLKAGEAQAPVGFVLLETSSSQLNERWRLEEEAIIQTFVSKYGDRWQERNGIGRGERDTYVCHLCGKLLNDMWRVREHCNSVKHQNKVYWLQNEQEGAELFPCIAGAIVRYEGPSQEPQTLRGIERCGCVYVCNLCSKQLPDLCRVREHCGTLRHQRKVFWLQQQDQDMPTPSLFFYQPPPPPPPPPLARTTQSSDRSSDTELGQALTEFDLEGCFNSILHQQMKSANKGCFDSASSSINILSALTRYDGREISERGFQENGYLAVDIGDHIEVMSEQYPGHRKNTESFYVYAKCVESGSEGWLPASVIGYF